MTDTSQVKKLTDDNFAAEVKDSQLPVLVDFWADWCAPCKAIAPHLETIAKENTGKLKVCKLNVDEQPNTSQNMGIRALPTLLLFKNGQVVEQIVGAVSKASLDEKIQPHL